MREKIQQLINSAFNGVSQALLNSARSYQIPYYCFANSMFKCSFKEIVTFFFNNNILKQLLFPLPILLFLYNSLEGQGIKLAFLYFFELQ